MPKRLLFVHLLSFPHPPPPARKPDQVRTADTNMTYRYFQNHQEAPLLPTNAPFWPFQASLSMPSSHTSTRSISSPFRNHAARSTSTQRRITIGRRLSSPMCPVSLSQARTRVRLSASCTQPTTQSGSCPGTRYGLVVAILLASYAWCDMTSVEAVSRATKCSPSAEVPPLPTG